MAAINKDAAFWESYVAGRPAVPPSWYNFIFEHHANHGGAFDLLHEPGAGSGPHAATWTSRFKSVVLSDISTQSIEIATAKLKDQAANVRCVVAGVEDSAALFAPQTVDMVVAFNMWHFANKNPERAMRAVVEQLKPGGTFAMATFAVCVLDDAAVQKCWTALFNRGSELLIAARKELTDGYLVRSTRLFLASDGDALEVPEEHFVPGTLRLKINYDESVSYRDFFIPPVLADSYPAGKSYVKATDRCETRDDEDWMFEADISRLRALFASHPLGFDDSVIHGLWEEMEKLMSGRTVHAKWLVHLVLATKK